jgi:[FeFe] hydrogenase H-cluster maturation GTPase HydF
MEQTPKSMRMQIALFGRTNVGKSSFLNMIANQDVAVTSTLPGTTTDVVEKAIELLPIGPVTILDTAGIDDKSSLADKRIERTLRIFDRADLVLLLIEPDIWSEHEEMITTEARKRNLPLIIIINKIDISKPSREFLDFVKTKSKQIVQLSSVKKNERDMHLFDFKRAIQETTRTTTQQNIPLLGDLVPPGGLAVLIVPIDLQAPKGRLILPQVQAIRDLLDNDAVSVVVKEREYSYALQHLTRKPDLVVCDSQVVMKMVADTPPEVKCTTFSILFSRYKGDLVEEVRGAAMIDSIHQGDKILIAEACSHHALEDDIGRVKIPRWLRQYLGDDVEIDFCQGRDYPDNLSDYKLVIHCGGCMLTRQEKLVRIQKSVSAGVPITNYGLAISQIQGVLERTLSPFPDALFAWRELQDKAD